MIGRLGKWFFRMEARRLGSPSPSAMKRTNFYFPEQLLFRLKTAKRTTGLSVSEMIRAAIEAYLKGLGV